MGVKKKNRKWEKKKGEKKGASQLFPPGLEPRTFRVLGERDNHYTTETGDVNLLLKAVDMV